MIEEGAEAPGFELPAVVEGEFDRVGLGDFLGQDVVVLAFYPADFNPACERGSTDLDELDLFTMQKDVTILALSADSVYSHRAFADEYDLHIPLLSDPGAEVAERYGVARQGVADADGAEGYLVDRAVVVVDPDGDVEYAWTTEDLEELPPVEEIREAVGSVGGDETARARYRVGHAHYVEGRRAFTSAMHGFEDDEWMMAQGDFTRAYEEFDEAADHFNTAGRFAEDEQERTYFERAEAKAEALWQAAEWLADAASSYASGEGAEGRAMRQDAEGPLETARDIHEPVAPDDFPPDEDPADLDDGEEAVRLLPEEEDDESATLDLDIDENGEGPVGDTDTDSAASSGDDSATEQPASARGSPTSTTDGPSGQGTRATGRAGDHETGGDGEEGDEIDGEDEIDDAELEEITAELEQQSAEVEAARAEAKAADAEDAGEETDVTLDDPAGIGEDDESAADDDPAGEIQFGEGDESSAEEAEPTDSTTAGDELSGEVAPDEDTDGDPDVGEVTDDVSEDDIELDLTDPTDGEGLGDLDDEEVSDGEAGDGDDEDDEDGEDADAQAGDPDDDLGGGGSHGVPDSL